MRTKQKALLIAILKSNLSELWQRTGSLLPKEIDQISTSEENLHPWVELANHVTEYLEGFSERKASNACVKSVFNTLNGNTEDMSWDACGKTLMKGLCYPKKNENGWNQNDYTIIQENVLKEFGMYNDSSAYFAALLDALEDDLFYVPFKGGNPEISFYQHMKMSMAVGNCLIRYFKELPSKSAAKEEKVCMLVSMDVSGIQDFIYTISSKGALKSLRARSFYLEILMEHLVDELLDKLELQRCNLIYSGGGHCYLLVPCTEDVRRIIDNEMYQFNEWLLQKFQTELYIGHGMCPCSVAQLRDEPSGSYADIFTTVSRQISYKKMHRYNAEQIRWLNHMDQGDGSRECTICKRMDKLDSESHCSFCHGILKFSKNILKQEYFAITADESLDGLELPNHQYLIPYDENSQCKVKRLYKKNGPDRKWFYAKQILVGDYAAKETLEELANESEGIERLAIYRADVDNLGNAFVVGFLNKDTRKNMTSLSRTAMLSKHLSIFFKYYINQLLEGMNVAIVYSGGDDLFILGAWDHVLDASLLLRKKLEAYTQGTLTLSGGIGIYSPNFPIKVMAGDAADLEDESKQQPDKNSITLFAAGHSYSWEIFEEKVMNEKYQILEDFFTTTEDRGNSFLYHLIELARECEDKINFVRFVYLLSRMEPTKSQAHSEEWEAYQRFSKSMYLWIQNEEDRRQMITAIYIYVYKNRKKVEE